MSKNHNAEFLLKLPPVDIVKLRSEVDFYGLGRIISQDLHYSRCPRSFSTWIHGWTFSELKYPEQLVWHSENAPFHLVSTQEETRFLESNGYNNVISAGLPFIYAGVTGVKRHSGALLVMPPHSLPYANVKVSELSFLDAIDSVRKNFSEIVFCIHRNCLDQSLWVENIKRYGFKFVIGASADDANSLVRLQKLFRSFEFVTTNTIGSHVLYASYCGCKVFFSGDYYHYSKEVYEDDVYYKKFPRMLEYNFQQSSEKQIRNKFPFFFLGSDKVNVEKEWADNQIGVAFKKDANELKKILGWSTGSQLVGYVKHYKKKIHEKLLC